jgi:murein DD-endopeptidase MepM/ murein hydrolase activator NlpD
MLETNTVKEGGIIKIAIHSNEPLKATDIEFMDKTYKAFYSKFDIRDTEYICSAVIPVPLGTKGTKKLTINYMLKDDKQGTKVEKIKVIQFKGRETKINTGMLNNTFEAEMTKENGMISKIQDEITPVKYDFPFLMPVAGVISGGFGDQRVYDNGEAAWRHKGIDIAAKKNTPIRAASSGNIASAMSSKAHGNYVIIDHGAGIYSFYFHMNKVYVKKGDSVSKGDIIGTVGSTGLATGPHLHWQIDVYKIQVNPMDFLAAF